MLLTSLRRAAALALSFALVACQAPDEAPGVSRAAVEVRGDILCSLDCLALSPEDFAAWYAKELGLDESHELRAEATLAGLLPGVAIHRYRHFYRGVEVGGEGLALHERSGVVVGASGTVTANIAGPHEPALSEEDAVAAVASELGRSVRLAAEGHECAIALRPPDEGQPEGGLEYVCRLAGEAPAGTSIATIDALTGEVVNARPYVLYGDWEVSPATVMTEWHGKRFITVNHYLPDDEYYLRGRTLPTLVGPPIQVLDGSAADPTQLPPAPTSDFVSPTPVFGADQRAGGGTYWAAEKTYEYLLSEWNLDPVAALTMQTLVGGFPVNDSAYLPAERQIFIGTYTFSGQLFHQNTLDAVAHEIGHQTGDWTGLINTERVVNRGGEYASLAESFSDVVGELVELDVFGATDWIHGAAFKPHTLAGTQWRDFAFPLGSNPPQPEVMYGSHWVAPTSALDNGGAHINASIANLWFYRLAQGDPAVPNVQPIGHRTAFAIYLGALASLTPPDSPGTIGSFGLAQQKAELTARTLCGPMSQALISSHNAWASVGYGSSIAAPSANPAAGATGVAPWPARLSWQAQAGAVLEDSWEVQISQDPSFPPDTTTTEVTYSLDLENGLDVGFVEVTLEPETTYHWRVRSLASEPTLNCWRPATSFTTGSTAPTPNYPSGPDIHPWAVPFSFTSPVQAATQYGIQVAWTVPFPTDTELAYLGWSQTNLVFPPQFLDAVPGDDVVNEITVPKLSELLWRVRALIAGPDGVIKGDWSQPIGFVTNEPEGVLYYPADQSAGYPWALTYYWQEVPGAAEYQLHRNYSSNSGGEDQGSHIVGENWFTRYEQPYLTADGQYIDWNVLPIGPPLGSTLTPQPPETRQIGKFSPTWRVYNDGDATPIQLQQNTTGCISTSSAAQFSWAAVPGVSHYEVFQGYYGPPIDWNPSSEPERVLDGTSLKLDYMDVLQGNVYCPTGNDDCVNLEVWAVAVPPSEDSPKKHGAAGARLGRATFQSTVPHNLVAQPSPTGNTVTLFWKNTFAGRHELELRAGNDCTGELLLRPRLNWSETVYSHPQHAIYLSNYDKSTEQVSLRIRGFTLGSSECPPSGWSNCVAFNLPAPEPPPSAAPPTPQIALVMTGSAWTAKHIFGWNLNCSAFDCGPDVLYYQFHPSPGADNYQIEFRPLSQPGNVSSVQVGEGFLANQRMQFINLLCSSPGAPSSGCHAWISAMLGDTYFGAYGGNDPTLAYEMRIRACAGTSCSAYSGWHAETVQ